MTTISLYYTWLTVKKIMKSKNQDPKAFGGSQILLRKVSKPAEYRETDNAANIFSKLEEELRSWWNSQVPQISGFLLEPE